MEKAAAEAVAITLKTITATHSVVVTIQGSVTTVIDSQMITVVTIITTIVVVAETMVSVEAQHPLTRTLITKILIVNKWAYCRNVEE